MNVALIFHNFAGDDQLIIDQVNPVSIIRSTNPDKLLGFRDIALDLDELVYFERKKIDWVMYVNNNDIRWADFLQLTKYVEIASDTVYLTGRNPWPWFDGKEQANMLGNFYCRPHVFTVLGNSYKIDIAGKLDKKSHLVSDDITKLIYGINRTGFDFANIP